MACVLTQLLENKEYGVATRIARVRDPDFSESEFLGHGKRLGIDLLINPNIVVAEEILDLIKTPAAAEVGKFADGKVLMLGLQIPARAPILGRPLKSLRSFHTTTPFLVVAVMRDGKLILPDGETTLREGDHIYFHFSLTAKWICTFCMLVGRLEVYSVLVLFFPEFWRK